MLLALGDVRDSVEPIAFKLQYTEPRHRFSAYQPRPEERCFLRVPSFKKIYSTVKVSVRILLLERCLDPRRLRQLKAGP